MDPIEAPDTPEPAAQPSGPVDQSQSVRDQIRAIADEPDDKPATPPGQGSPTPPTPPEPKPGDPSPKLWEREPATDPQGHKPAANIPLPVLLEERRGRQEAERQLAELRAQHGVPQPGAQPAPTPGADPLQPVKFSKTIADFNGDPEAYLSAREEHTFSEAQRIADARAEYRFQSQQAQQVEQQMEQSFQGRVAEASKANPDVAKAVAWISQPEVIQTLPIELRGAMVTDDEGPQKIHHIMSTPELHGILSMPGIHGALAFARLRLPAAAPAAPPPPPAPRGALPRVTTGGQGSGAQDLDGLEDLGAFEKEFTKRFTSKGYRL